MGVTLLEMFAGKPQSIIEMFAIDPGMAAIVLVVALAVLFGLFFAGARLVCWILGKIMRRGDVPLAGARITMNIVRVFIWIIFAALVLDFVFGVDVSGIIAALGVGGLAISLAFQETLANLISGFLISTQKVIDIGDRVVIGGSEGHVRDMTWRHTVIEDYEGNIVTVPNSVINKQNVIVRPDFMYTETQVLIRYKSVPEGKTLDDVLEEISGPLAEGVSSVVEIVEGPFYRFKGTTEFGYSGKVCFKTKPDVIPAVVHDAVIRKMGELRV